MEQHFDESHDNPTDCQLILCITGSKSEVKAKLYSILKEMDSVYGKPVQGTMFAGFTSSVITPVWNGEKY